MTASERRMDVRQIEVSKHYLQFHFITINCVEFHSYIHTTHIFILFSFFKDGKDAGAAPTTEPRTSNSRGIGGIFG